MARIGKWMLAACAWLGALSVQAADAVLEGTRLFIPTVNTQGEVAKYQNAVFTHVGGAEWRLLSFDETGNGVYLAPVTEVWPLVTDTFPAHVLLRVRGVFGSGCGDLGRITQRRNGDRFTVVINRAPSPGTDIVCSMGMVPFTTTISLPVYGLAAGGYSYDVNGITGTFELTRDNALPGDCPNVSEGWCTNYQAYQVTDGTLVESE